MQKSKISSKMYIMSDQQLKTTKNLLKKIKYPVHPISNAMPINQKIKTLHLQPKIKLKEVIQPSLNAYRKVRGDGNCFFRAFGFSCIANIRSSQVSTVFSLLDEISLESCIKKTIPRDFQPFYNDEVLKQVLRKYWQQELLFFLRSTQHNYKRALARMLTQNHYLDFIMILYFRALCLYAFKQNKQQFKEFLKGTQQQQIRTYGEQSEGVILDLCSKFLQMNIGIYQIRKQDVVTYQYTNLRGSLSTRQSWIHLLYMDGHYDLFQVNPNPSLQYYDEKLEQDVYGEVNNKMMKGKCIECNLHKEIGEENGLCLDCFNRSMSNLKTFQKDKMIEAVCQQCHRYRKDVSQQMRFCKQCLLSMQYEANPQGYQFRSDVKPASNGHGANPHQNKAMGLCKKCRKEVSYQDMNQYDICFGCTFDSDTSKIGKSKINTSSRLTDRSDGEIPSLQGRYESRPPNRHSKQEGPSTCKAQLFTRRSQIQHTCSECKKVFTLSKEQPDNTMCKQCLKSNTKSQLRSTRTLVSPSHRTPVTQSTIVSSSNVCISCRICCQAYILQKHNGYCRKCFNQKNMMRGKIWM